MKLSTAVFALFLAPSAAFAPSFVPRPATALGVGMLDRQTGKSQLDPAVIAKYSSLPFPADKVLAEYVWVDAAGNTRSKTRTLPAKKVRGLRVEPCPRFGQATLTRCVVNTGQVGRDAPQVEL